MITLPLPSPQSTEALGARLARVTQSPCTLYLRGELGAGKTTLVRGFLRARGHTGSVKSPTYTLVEPYILDETRIFHFDLYRLADPEELEYIGLRDFIAEQGILIVEWPERGQGLLPAADLDIELRYAEEGRRCHLTAGSNLGEAMLAKLGEEERVIDPGSKKTTEL